MVRILVVDADPGERLVLRSRLMEHGYDVALAENGAKGLVEARAGAFDLMLLAASLGTGVEGNEVCRRLKAIPQLNGVPLVVYATSTNSPEACARAYDAGADAFVSKSQMAALDQIVEVMLGFRARLEELGEQNRNLELAYRSVQEERQQESDLRATGGVNGSSSLVVREMAAARPDGMLIVDEHGCVVNVDRGACELLGTQLEGKRLGQIVPSSGLEAFVRDARTEPRDQFRFDVRGCGRGDRSLMATAIPVTARADGDAVRLRVVLLLDVGKRKVAEEMVRLGERGLPQHQVSTLLEAARATYRPEAIVGHSERIVQIRRRVTELSRLRGHVLVRGERGSGKGFLARVLHYGGPLSGAFLSLRCASLTPENLERELFGYAKGAFPGAIADRPGLVSMARDGTLFLSEIADLPLRLQEKLLRVLETGTVSRIGSTRSEPIDLRIVASTSIDLEEQVRKGAFLPELYERLGRLTLQVPALREFLADLPAIGEHYLRHFGGRHEVSGIEDRGIWVMQQYDWPGNLAELEDCIEKACSRAAGRSIDVPDLTRPLRDLFTELPDPELIPAVRPVIASAAPLGSLLPQRSAGGPAEIGVTPRFSTRAWDISDDDPISLELYEKKALLRALDSCNGDKLAAAKLLKVGKSTLYRKLKRLGLS